MLQKGEGEHRHECMAVKALPGSPFEVVEPKFLFQLLMGLLANPRPGRGQFKQAKRMTGRCRIERTAISIAVALISLKDATSLVLYPIRDSPFQTETCWACLGFR